MAIDIQDALFEADDMTLEDIPAVMEIEKTAFPIPWPEQAYRHEILENRNGYFIVVRLNKAATAVETDQRQVSRKLFGRLTGRPSRTVAPRPILGFAGMWMLVDEGHISTIASRTDWRGRGVGELLLVTLLREAQRRSAIFATLEVRVNNVVAQNLYRKYGFTEVGRRRRYYRDNDEDALIMTVENFVEPEYRAQLDALEQALRAKLARQAA